MEEADPSSGRDTVKGLSVLLECILVGKSIESTIITKPSSVHLIQCWGDIFVKAKTF